MVRSVIVAFMLGILVACGGGGGKEPPLLASVIPASGGVGGGTAVTLHGVRLSNDDGTAPVVRFGDADATGVVVVDDGTVTCVSPPGAAGTVDVTLVAGHGVATLDGFTYHPAPTLASVQPAAGPVAGGIVLTLLGTGFLANDPGPTSVRIGVQQATGVTVLNDTTLTCTAPAQAALGAFAVEVSNANGAATLAGGYATVPSPALFSVVANDGPAGGYTDVVLQGANFDVGGLAVSFGGLGATHVEVLSSATLVCRTPPAAPGTVAVQVSTFGGTATLAAAYTYTTWAPDDPLYGDQWHLENTAQHANSTAGEDARLPGAWTLGYTGRGVKVAVVDDGLELAHPDLAANVVAGSWDYGDDDADPTRNEHGTSVAGVSSGVGGNLLGGTGAAPASKVVGFAVLTGGTTDGDFADALARGAASTHLYNNSWGQPAVYGGIYYGFSASPYSLHAAVEEGLSLGRGGLGSVYMKAAGNSGLPPATLDGTNGMRGVNVIGAVNSDGTATYYSQPGACVLVCAPSNDVGGRPGITTTDRTGAAGYAAGDYTSTFGGTSSATPLVTGVAALVLEARPQLRWWEVPLVLALSARRNDPSHFDWVQNGAGHWVNHQYGFGVVDAEAAVQLARTWTPLPGLVSASGAATVEATVTAGDPTPVGSDIVIPAGTGLSRVHTATVTVYLDHPYATDLDIYLTSPDGTTSLMLYSLRTTDPADTASSSAAGIPMVSWQHLGETPAGTWTLQVRDGQGLHDCTWSRWTLTLEGEGVPPAALTAKPTVAAASRPAAPRDLRLGEVAWWTGTAWARAQREPALVSVPVDADGAPRVAPDDVVEVVAREGARAVVRLRADAAPASDAWPVLRDGPRGDGALRALTGRVLVRWADGATDGERARVERALGLRDGEPLAAGPFWARYAVAEGADTLEAAQALLGLEAVAHAAPDWWRVRRAN